MNYRTYVAAGAIVASLGLPAAASAHQECSAASVQAHVKASAKAFQRVEVLTQADRDAAAATKLKVGLRELRLAARETARLGRGARSTVAVRRVVRLERIVGASADASAGVLAEVVAEAQGAAEVRMAGAISTLLELRQQAVAALTGTLDVASDTVDAVAVAAIVELTADAEDDVSAISEALASADLSAKAAVKLSGALNLATQSITEGLATLQAIAGQVSAGVQSQVSAAVEQVTAQLVQAKGTIEALTNALLEAGTDAAGSIVLPDLGILLGLISVQLSVEADAQASAGYVRHQVGGAMA